MGKRLTEGQLSYLTAAAGAPIPFDKVRAGASKQCAEKLVEYGLLARKPGGFHITPAGRRSLTGARE